jgi:hypothetical protein
VRRRAPDNARSWSDRLQRRGSITSSPGRPCGTSVRLQDRPCASGLGRTRYHPDRLHGSASTSGHGASRAIVLPENSARVDPDSGSCAQLVIRMNRRNMATDAERVARSTPLVNPWSHQRSSRDPLGDQAFPVHRRHVVRSTDIACVTQPFSARSNIARRLLVNLPEQAPCRGESA